MTIVDSATPPATAIAKGGQNPPPARISGRKPPTVVIVVETTCRDNAITKPAVAATSPDRQ
jgi:hypothetical protein